jgi:thiamine pyrophosphate-dependent acetolactate synthase large subunit-like protein
VNTVDAVAAVLEGVPEALVVASLGTATSALRQASGDGPHLYLGGSMGSALAVALGVAEARPRREVIAFVGDGETLMGAGTLWSLAGLRPANLLTVVLANGSYGITGRQPLLVPTAFVEIASALGLDAARAGTPAETAERARDLPRPALLEVAVDDDTWPGPSPFVDPPVVRWRFEQEAQKEG